MKLPVISRPLVDEDGEPVTLFGIPIRVDETMPAEQIELRRVKTDDGRLTEEARVVSTVPRRRRKRHRHA